MGRGHKIGAFCLAGVLGLALGGAGDATAKKKHRAKTHETTQVTVQTVGPDGITGRIDGSDKACRAQRQITVYRVNSGPSVPSGEFVASTWTHGDGSWSVPGPMFPSEFFAVVDAKSAKRVVCSAATSNFLLWG
jgi:hypothetical protein